jgi:hypothetical protein
MKFTPSAFEKLPDDVLRHILRFIPEPPKKKKSIYTFSLFLGSRYRRLS